MAELPTIPISWPRMLLAWALLPASAWTQSKPFDLSQSTIEDLMNIEVTSVSKKEQKISRTAAAIFVITADDIVRSGATNIPDLLRMVPGLDVGQINANTWAISARGFSHELADKLLVLIDGRSVYTLTFGGVDWDTQDVPLEDISRIEVIRGPGGTMWGANAMNGVINIITKKAGDTSGPLVTTGGGSQQRSFGTVRFGGKLGDAFSYRVFIKALDQNQTPDFDDGDNSGDAWHLVHGGFRVDGNLSPLDSLTIQGDIYSGREGAEIVHTSLAPPENQNIQVPAALSGGNVLGRWNHIFSNGSDATLQFYFDRNRRDGSESLITRNTFDLDFQHRAPFGDRHDVVWGLGYRLTSDRTIGTIDQDFNPPNRGVQIFNAFLQDEITLRPDRLFLTVGVRLEHDDFHGFDTNPSARLAWALNEHQTVWGAISRASRTPSRVDTAGVIAIAAFPGGDGLPREVLLLGNPNQRAEHVVATEAGYRTQLTRRLSLDAAGFFNSYSDLRTREPGAPFFVSSPGPERWIIPIQWGNLMHGNTYGVELAADWKIAGRWLVSPGYTLLLMHLHPDAASKDADSPSGTAGSNPRHQAQLRSSFDIRRGLAWDVNLYYVDQLPAQGIPAYSRLDSQLRWRLNSRLDFSIVGQNLLHDHHPESNDIFTVVNASQIKRGVFARLTWRP